MIAELAAHLAPILRARPCKPSHGCAVRAGGGLSNPRPAPSNYRLSAICRRFLPTAKRASSPDGFTDISQRLQKSVKRPVPDLPAEIGTVADGTPKMEPDVTAAVTDLVGHRLKAVVAADDSRRAGRRGRAERNVVAKDGAG